MWPGVAGAKTVEVVEAPLAVEVKSGKIETGQVLPVPVVLVNVPLTAANAEGWKGYEDAVTSVLMRLMNAIHQRDEGEFRALVLQAPGDEIKDAGMFMNAMDKMYFPQGRELVLLGYTETAKEAGCWIVTPGQRGVIYPLFEKTAEGLKCRIMSSDSALCVAASVLQGVDLTASGKGKEGTAEEFDLRGFLEKYRATPQRVEEAAGSAGPEVAEKLRKLLAGQTVFFQIGPVLVCYHAREQQADVFETKDGALVERPPLQGFLKQYLVKNY